ncbi:MAG: glycine cleavage system protein GcvH [bacterium]|nr:glycine cleavage system protein GcvH [bacterium]
METRADCRYSQEHEWAKKETDGFRVGISDYAQSELGDVVYVDLPQPGSSVKAGQSFMTVESVKAVSDVYAPFDGEVVSVNEQLADAPELLNTAPFDGGWLVLLRANNDADYNKLMSADDYKAFVAESSK